MIQFLGVLDLVSAGVLVGRAYHLPIAQWLLISVIVYLVLKAILFLLDIASLFDLMGGILLILSFFMALPPVLFFIAAGLIALKGLMSLFA